LLGGGACCPQAAGFGQPPNASAVAISNKMTNDRLFKVPSQFQEQVGQSHLTEAAAVRPYKFPYSLEIEHATSRWFENFHFQLQSRT